MSMISLDILALLFGYFIFLGTFRKKTLSDGACILNYSRVVLTINHMVFGKNSERLMITYFMVDTFVIQQPFSIYNPFEYLLTESPGRV